MSKYAIFRVEKIGSKSEATKRARHNMRERGAALSDKDGKPKLKHLVMEGSSLRENREKLKTFAKFSKERIGDQKVRKNACYGFEVIMTFSPGAVKPEDLRPWTAESMKFVADKFGIENLYSAQIHLSETTPHIHVITGAIDSKGKLNANGIIRGPSHLRELQTEYAKHMERFGLERGLDKSITKAKHKKAREYMAENAEKAIRLDTYEKVFGTEKEWDMDQFIAFQSVKGDLTRELAPEDQNLAQEPFKLEER